MGTALIRATRSDTRYNCASASRVRNTLLADYKKQTKPLLQRNNTVLLFNNVQMQCTLFHHVELRIVLLNLIDAQCRERIEYAEPRPFMLHVGNVKRAGPV